MLLNHTSGIPEFTTNDYWNNNSFVQPYREWQPTEVVDLVRNGTFVAPATAYSYCNTGYIVAGNLALFRHFYCRAVRYLQMPVGAASVFLAAVSCRRLETLSQGNAAVKMPT